MPTITEDASSTLAALMRAHSETARTLCRQGRKYARIQERWCSEEMSETTTRRLEAQESRLENRIRANAAKLGAEDVEFQGDPRGYTVHLIASGHWITLQGS